MRYFIFAILFSSSALAGEYDYIGDSPFIYQPSEPPRREIQDQSFQNEMNKDEPQPIYVPVYQQKDPSPLNEGGLKGGW